MLFLSSPGASLLSKMAGVLWWVIAVERQKILLLLIWLWVCAQDRWDHQIDSILSSFCSVFDCRWHQNVVRVKLKHTRHNWVCHWCSYFILMSCLICKWTDSQLHGIYMFYLIIKQKTINDDVIFRSVLKVRGQSKCMGDSADYVTWSNQIQILRQQWNIC